jgi:hypothetical protein
MRLIFQVKKNGLGESRKIKDGRICHGRRRRRREGLAAGSNNRWMMPYFLFFLFFDIHSDPQHYF